MTTEVTNARSELAELADLADDIFAAATEPVLDAQQIGLAFDSKLWTTLAGAGLTLLATPESAGGSGAGLAELAVVLERSGYHAAPVPLAEHDLLGSWLLRAAGLTVPATPMSVAVTEAALSDERVVATLEHVPWATAVETLVVAGPGFVAAVPRGSFTVSEDSDIAGVPTGTVIVDAVPASAGSVDGDLAGEFALRGALACALQTCGALSRALDLSCEHVGQREQFGRPIAKFQAVQTLLASAAGALAVAQTAAWFAVDVVSTHGFASRPGEFAVCVAKIESARAATAVARNAHQAHGAIGFTLDHRLRHFTNRALALRSRFGTQRHWQLRLGQMVLESEGSAWEVVTGLSTTALP